MIIDCILEYVTFLKPMQSLGAKTRFGTCRDFETFNRFELMYFQAFTQFGNNTSFSHRVEFK